jgi:hypothetical protein
MKKLAGAALLLGPLLLGCAGIGPIARNAPVSDAGAEVPAGCPPERLADGEVRLVFLGDSGYGTGSSEWGTPGQEAIAGRINNLSLAPDLVFLLGDNIYWKGSASLYKTRFDDVYQPLIRQCKVHVALGNHDLKGCRAGSAEETAGGCIEKLATALATDRAAQYLRQGIPEQEARERAERETRSETEGEPGVDILRARRANCLPADASAYQDRVPGDCHASAALKHAQFGFGATDEEGPLEERRQRYYSVPWPVPRRDAGGGASADPVARSLVNVLVLDSNTLRARGGLLEDAREDRLQLLWLRRELAWGTGGGAGARAPWKIVAMHHPLHTPRSCACRLFGRCMGGHTDEPALQEQFRSALAGADAPDLVIAAHNHIYARSHPLDASGAPLHEGQGGVRHFVSGGGGAPLYAIERPDRRFARALTMYHFLYLRLTESAAFFWAVDQDGRVRDSGCFERGSNVDRPLSRDFGYADPLPAGCKPPDQ